MKVKSLLLIFFCALCWGPSYLFIKIALPEIPALTIAFTRVAIGAIFTYLICLLQGYKIASFKYLWKHFVVMGITLNALPFFLVSYSEHYISSSLTGILNSLTLIFTAIIAHFFGKHDRLNKNKLFGIAAGVLGLCTIYVPMLLHESISSSFGVSMVVIACVSYGTGTVYARSHLSTVPGTVALAFQLTFAAILLLPFTLWIDQPLSLAEPSQAAIWSAIALGVIGTAAGFYFYYRAIQVAGSTYAALAVLFIPIIAILLGAIFLKEEIRWNQYLGAFFILIGVVAINPALKKIVKK